MKECSSAEDRHALKRAVSEVIKGWMYQFPDSRVYVSIDIWEDGQEMDAGAYLKTGILFDDRTGAADRETAWESPDCPFRDEEKE